MVSVGSTGLDVFMSNGGIYAATVHGQILRVLNLTNPTTPSVLDSIDFGLASLAPTPKVDIGSVDGRIYAAIAVDTSFFTLIDITNPANIIKTATYTAHNTPHAVEMVSLDGAAFAAVLSTKPDSIKLLRLYGDMDEAPPVMVSATYRYIHGLHLTFDEDLSAAAPGVYIREPGESSGGVSLPAGTVSGNTLSIQIPGNQATTVDAIIQSALDSNPDFSVRSDSRAHGLLDIDAGSVHDLAGNPTQARSDVSIDVAPFTLTKVVNDVWHGDFGTLHLFEHDDQNLLARGFTAGIELYDMSNLHPVLLSKPAIGSTSDRGYFTVFDHFIKDGHTYLIASHVDPFKFNGLRVYDITNPATPSLLTTWSPDIPEERLNDLRIRSASVYWANDIPYVVANTEELGTGFVVIKYLTQIINMSDPANPSRVHTLDDTTSFGAIWSAEGRTYIVAASIPHDSGIILDITDPSFPYVVEGPRAGLSSFESHYPSEILEYGGGIWGLSSSAFGQIYVWDLTDPYAGSLVGTTRLKVDTTSWYTFPAVATFDVGGRPYMIIHNIAGHHVVDISNPYDPRKVAPTLSNRVSDGDIVTFKYGSRTIVVDGGGDIFSLERSDSTLRAAPAPVAASYNSANSLLRVNFTLPITEVKHAYLGHDDQFLFTVRDANTNSSIDIITTPHIDRATQVVFQLSDAVNEYIKNNLTDIVLDIDQSAVNGLDHLRSEKAEDITITRGDHVPPSPLSVIRHNSALVITFDEIMQTTNTAGIQVRGMTHTFNLTGASFNGTVATFQLTPEQITQINNMTSPSLFIVANAFQDPQGNLVRPNVIPIVSAQAMASPTSLSLDVQDSSLVAVSNLVATSITNDTITISWAGQAGAEGYEVQWTDPQGGKAAAHLPSIFGTTHQIEDLTPDTEYVIRVAPSANGTVHEIYASANLTVRTLPASQLQFVPAQLQYKSENLVSNGSFEAPTVSDWGHISSGTAGLIWSVSGGPMEIHNELLGGASDGSQYVELDSTASVTISQTISTTSGQTYDISFDYKARPDTVSSTNGIQVQWNGVDIVSGITFGDTWQTHTVTVNGTGSDTISFIDAGTSDGLGTFLDNVLITTHRDTIPPVITITGSASITILQGDSYTDAGATCVDDTDGVIQPISSGIIDTTTVGIYTISYNCTDTAGNAAPQVSRKVGVQNTTDTTPPVITINGNVTITIQTGDTYTDAGATCADDTDGVIQPVSSGTVDTTISDSYTISYRCTDTAGNAADIVTRSVIVQNPPDVTPPVITMNGNATVTIHKGDTYTDAGATCVDDTNGVIPPVPVGMVDTTTTGSYTITYHCADTSGNIADTVTRSVIVQNPPDTQPATPQMPVNLVQNGSFETPTVSGWSHVSSGTAGLIWSVSGGPMEIHNEILGGASDGSQHIELDSTGSVTISQTISTTSGQSYMVSFDYKARPDTTQATNGIQVQWNGADIVSGITFGDTWQTHTVTVTGTGSDTISFIDAGTSDGVGTFLDNVSVIEVTP